ncbi:hypothetical protein PO909_015221 [Leuciscus waleckii]
MHNIRKIRPFLTEHATQLIVQALVISRLDYCNALLAGLPACATKPLQMIQNAAARLVFNEPKRAHVTPLFISLHWLPLAARIKFKALTLAYRTITGSAPSYFHSLLRVYIPTRHLRSEHVQHVRRVLQRLLENGLFVKAEKCVFHAQSVPFLGYIISSEGVRMDPDKVKAVIDCPSPDSLKALQRFLGFANFCRRFIRNFSQLAAPLTALTSPRTTFRWSDTAEAVFAKMKSRFVSAPILVAPDPSRQFVVEVDASEVGNPSSWSQQLSMVEYAHNSLPVSSTGLSPFECSLGYQPPIFLSLDSEVTVPSAHAFVQRCHRTWTRARETLLQF